MYPCNYTELSPLQDFFSSQPIITLLERFELNFSGGWRTWNSSLVDGYLNTHCQSQSQSHLTTDSQSLSWCRTPSGAYDPKLFIYFSFRTVTVFSMWAPSLTRGRVCRLSVSPLCDVFVRII
jgi:hypothetical protein